MINYNQFDDAVKTKKAQMKYLYIEDGASIFFIFKDMEMVRAKNSFSGEIEDQWHYALEDMDGNPKEWDTGSLAIFNQFKDQDIQPDDKILITKEVSGKKVRYVIKKEMEEEVKKENMDKVKEEDIPVEDEVDETA